MRYSPRPTPGAPMKQRLTRIAAWLVTLAILGYLFWRYPIADVLRALGRAAPWTVPALALLVVPIYLADSFAIARTFTWFVAPLRYREVLAIRGATYLLALVNYTIGQGAIVYFVHRSRGVPVLRGAAAVLLIMGINLLMLLLLATAGMALGADTVPALRTLIYVAYAGLAVYLTAVALRPRFLTARPIFDVLLSAGLSGHLKALLVRAPHICCLLAFSYVSLRAFDVRVPPVQAVLCLPVVFLIAVLPISVGGFGTTQAAMIYFFARYAPGDAPNVVLAASLGSQAVSLAAQAVIGLICLRTQIARDLQRPRAQTSAPPAA